MAQMTDASHADAARILCVDDEPRVLEALENHLAFDFDVHLATSGKEGLEILAANEAFSVVVSDMRMPEMNGAAFLQCVRQQWPDVTRMLLTGYSEMESAISAINEGGIFRFLTKPCAPDDLAKAIRDGIRQNELVLAERKLLQETVAGAVATLVEVMGLTMPDAFNRSDHLKSYVQRICSELGIKDTWRYEIAATVAHLGYITLPEETLKQIVSKQNFDSAQRDVYRRVPETGKRLLSGIPRLELVAEIVGQQRRPPLWNGTKQPETDADIVALGANLIAIATAFDSQRLSGKSTVQAVETLRCSTNPRFSSDLLSPLMSLEIDASTDVIQSLSLHQLTTMMTLEEPIRSQAGQVVVGAGRRLNQALLERLYNFARGRGIEEPIRVRTHDDEPKDRSQ